VPRGSSFCRTRERAGSGGINIRERVRGLGLWNNEDLKKEEEIEGHALL